MKIQVFFVTNDDTIFISAFDNTLFTEFIDEKEEEPYKTIIDNVADVCNKHYAVSLNKNIVKLMIDNLSELYPGIR